MSGVHVCEVRPGYIKTNLSLNAVTENGLYGKTDENTEKGMNVETMAKNVLDDVERGRDVINVGVDFKSWVGVWLGFLWEGGLRWFMKRKFQKEEEKRKLM